MLGKEFDYYIAHQDELVKKYNGKVLVIKGEQVMKALNSLDRAYSWATT